jgi:hypothetical protein
VKPNENGKRESLPCDEATLIRNNVYQLEGRTGREGLFTVIGRGWFLGRLFHKLEVK